MKFDDILVTTAIPVTVPADFYDLWLNNIDLFMHSHCGYYWRQVEWDKTDPTKGHLAWDFESDERVDEHLEKHRVNFIDHLTPEQENELHTEAIAAWKERRPLPQHYYAINKDVVTKAYIEGVKRGGTSWYEDGDGNDYDIAFQMAVYGEHVYA